VEASDEAEVAAIRDEVLGLIREGARLSPGVNVGSAIAG
jgi:hypothetical protein